MSTYLASNSTVYFVFRLPSEILYSMPKIPCLSCYNKLTHNVPQMSAASSQPILSCTYWESHVEQWAKITRVGTFGDFNVEYKIFSTCHLMYRLQTIMLDFYVDGIC